MESKGFITIAQGASKYIEMAKNLGYSLSITNPELKRAVVTDSQDEELYNIFDIVIAVNVSAGVGTQQKLLIYEYSPFDKTMFIDCDCIVTRNLDFLWESFSSYSVGVIGSKFSEYTHWGINVEKLKDKLNLEYLIRFNGGLYYFAKDDLANHVYSVAYDLLDKYKSLGIDSFRGGIGEEPLMSISMSLAGINPLDDKGKGMYTPIGLQGPMNIDALTGHCSFMKHGVIVEPAVVHFCGEFSDQFHYRREAFKIRAFVKNRLPKAVISKMINLIFNTTYAGYIISYRTVRAILGRQSFKFNPLLPVFRSW